MMQHIDTSSYKVEITSRHFFQANLSENMIWASCDYSSQELLLAAALAKDEVIADIYRKAALYSEKVLKHPVDPEGNSYKDPSADQHIMALGFMYPDIAYNIKNAPWLAHKGIPKIAKLRNERGKPFNYKTIYGGSAGSFASQLQIDLNEAQKLLRNYFKGFYKLKEWLDWTGEIVSRLGYVRTATGRMIACNEANAKGISGGNTAKRRGTNAIIQGSGADMTKIAQHLVQQKLDSLNWKYRKILNGREPQIINCTHDEINVLIPGNLDRTYELNNKSNLYEIKTNLNESEKELTLEYGQLILEGMKQAEQIIFNDYLNYELPSLVEIGLSYFWEH